jgi:hypothetical protein
MYGTSTSYVVCKRKIHSQFTNFHEVQSCNRWVLLALDLFMATFLWGCDFHVDYWAWWVARPQPLRLRLSLSGYGAVVAKPLALSLDLPRSAPLKTTEWPWGQPHLADTKLANTRGPCNSVPVFSALLKLTPFKIRSF